MGDCKIDCLAGYITILMIKKRITKLSLDNLLKQLCKGKYRERKRERGIARARGQTEWDVSKQNNENIAIFK